MTILDKLKFWKKEEPAEFDLGRYPSLEVPPNLPGSPEPGQDAFPGMIPRGGPGLTEMPHEHGMPGEELSPVPLPPNVREMRGQPSFAPARVGASADQPALLALPAQLQPAFAAPAAAPAADMSREMQVVNAKLDTLKALIDSISAKLDRIERSQQKEEEAVPLSIP
ncbi:MAG: hypothetical protein ACREUY_01445, partial [Burkholderiales bacterium]